MALTTEQLPALKAAIAAETDQGFAFARENGQMGVMATFFNVEASPAFYISRALELP